jgi:hypothetical protein
MWISSECKLEISKFNTMAIGFLFGNNELTLYFKDKLWLFPF